MTEPVFEAEVRVVLPLCRALDNYSARVESLKSDLARAAEEATTLANMRELRLFKGLPEEHTVKTAHVHMRSLLMSLNGRN